MRSRCRPQAGYRRVLQDYEYGWLLKQAGREKIADANDGTPFWSRDVSIVFTPDSRAPAGR